MASKAGEKIKAKRLILHAEVDKIASRFAIDNEISTGERELAVKIEPIAAVELSVGSAWAELSLFSAQHAECWGPFRSSKLIQHYQVTVRKYLQALYHCLHYLRYKMRKKLLSIITIPSKKNT